MRHKLIALLTSLLLIATSLAETTPTGNDTDWPWGMPVAFETGPDGLPLSTTLELLARSVNLTPVFEGIPDVTVTYNIPGHRPFGQLWVLITNLHNLESLLLDGGIIVVAPEGNLEALKPAEPTPEETAAAQAAAAAANEPVINYTHEFHPLPANAESLITALEVAYPDAAATILPDANSLLINAPEDQHPSITVFIDDYRARIGLAALDQPAPDNTPLSTAYYPSGPDGEALSNTLQAQFPGITIAHLQESNLLAVYATQQQHAGIADQLNRLNSAQFHHADAVTRAYHQISHGNPTELLETVRSAMGVTGEDPEQAITLDPTTRTIVLTGSNTFIAEAQTVLRRLDRELPQVNIKVRFQEVTTSATEQLGINLANSIGLLALNLGGNGLNFLLNPASQGVNSLNIHATLDLLEEQNLSKNLRDTNLTVTSGVEGTFNSGGRIDIVLPSGNSDESNEVQTIEYGTMLSVTPFVTEDNKIRLQINAGVSGFQNELSDLSGIQLSTREIDTLVTTENGQALVIAGLLENTVDVVQTGVPFLKDIPIIGALFRSTTNRETSSDVMIVITADIVEPDTMAGTAEQ